MSRFEPVFLPEGRRLNGKVSQTFLRHANMCMRSGYLYSLFKGEASTVEMQRGRAVHSVIERAILAGVENEEPTIPPDLVKAIVNEVLAETPVPFEEHDYIREMAFRWGSEFTFDPAAVIALETLFVLDVAGFEVRAKVDFAQLTEKGAAVWVPDWKSSKAAPAFDEVSRKRPDGSLMAKNFQLVLYALALAFGVPVREEVDENGERVEVREPFPVAQRVQRFDLEFVFPGIEDNEGKMLRRPVSLTRLELEEYRSSLESLVLRVAESERTGDWPAVTSDQGCSECPAKRLCPIPAEMRDNAGRINTAEEAAEAAEVLDRRKAIDAAVRKELFAFVKTLPGERLRFGRDQVIEPSYSESTRIADKDALFDAVDRAVQYGEPFERARFVKTVKSAPLKQRRLSEAELAEESAEGSNEEAA